MHGSKSRARFFMSPISGRIIMSSGRTYKKLKEKGFVLDRHKCLYNIKSAQSCMATILAHYPSLAYPPSDLMDIPRTYRHGVVRSFISNGKEVLGFIDKKGNIAKLRKAIPLQKMPIVEDPTHTLPAVLNKLKPVQKKVQKAVEEQVREGELIRAPDTMVMVYNPVHNHFVPLREKIPKNEQLRLIDTINKTLVPESLPPIIPEGRVAGIVEDKGNMNKSAGVVTVDNQLVMLDTPSIAKGVNVVKVHTPEAHAKEKPLDEKEALLREVQCIKGQQYDIHKSRCLPCEQYGLVWDDAFGKCRIERRPDADNPVLLVTEGNEIIGYM